MTWEQLVESLKTHERRANKEGPGFAPTEFKKERCTCGMMHCPRERGHRINQNVVRVHALALDLDKGFDGSAMTIEAANAVLEKLVARGVEFCVYSTHSYKPPEKAALRALVRLSRPVEAAEWERFWHAAIGYLGIPVGTGSQKGKADPPARFWYLPSAPEGAEVLAGSFPGAPLDVDALLASAPAPEQKKEKSTGISYTDFPEADRKTVEAAWTALLKHGPHVQGQSSDGHTFQACAIALNDWALSDEIAWPLIEAWNKSSQPPYPEDKLRDTFERCAKRYATGEPGKARADHIFAEVMKPLIPKPEAPELAPETTHEFKPALRADEISKLERKPKKKYATWCKALDFALGGGLWTRRVTTICAPPGAGKTAFVTQTTLYLEPTIPALHISTELDTEEMVSRYDGNASNRSWSQLDENAIKWCDALDGKRIHFIGCDDLPAETDKVFELIEQNIAALKDKYGVAPLLVVDYVQDIVRGASDDKKRGAVGMAIKALRQIAVHHDCVVIAVSSVSRGFYSGAQIEKMRENDDARVFLAAAKESGDIDFDSGAVLFLDVDPSEDGNDQNARIAIAKARSGHPGRFVGAKFTGLTGRWAESIEAAEAMRPESRAERKRLKQATTDAEIVLRMVRELHIKNEHLAKTVLAQKCGGNYKRMLSVVELLLDDGRLESCTEFNLRGNKNVEKIWPAGTIPMPAPAISSTEALTGIEKIITNRKRTD